MPRHRQQYHASDRRRPFALNTVARRLAALVLLMLVPISVIAALAALALYKEEREAVLTAARATARSLSLVVEREIGERAAILRTLATSPALERGDLEAFHREASLVAPGVENVIVFSDIDGRQVFNTGAPLSSQPNEQPAAIADMVRRQQSGWAQSPMVSGLYDTPVGQRKAFAVQIPVLHNGELRGFLAMRSLASELQRIYRHLPVPPGWIVSVVDGQGTVMARSQKAEQLVGRRASANMAAALQAADAGEIETSTLDGLPVLTVWQRAPQPGWAVLVGMSRDELRRPALQALATVSGAALVLVILSGGMAWWVGRGIVGPVQQLHDDAMALGRGDPVPEQPTGLVETDAVRRLLAQAGRERAEADRTLRDRVEQAVAESERAQKAALTTQKLEALGRLTGGIAHDFNNLLQTMTTGLQLARRLAADDRARTALAACDRAVSKAVQLTRQLMTFGRAQPGRLEVVDLYEQIMGMAELLRGALRDDMALTLDVPPDLGAVKVDPVQFELAVLNLTLNARDALEGRRGSVAIRADRVVLSEGRVAGMPPGPAIRLTVSDNGGGIAPETLAHVFEPFFTTKAVGRGSGLGLAQVYGFAKGSGGMATVHSRLGEGTAVTLWLPPCTPLAPPTPSALMPLDDAQYSGTVLLVEDEDLVRELVAQGLSRHGFEVCVAANVAEALVLARQRNDIDVVLSDIVMPGGQSGIDLLNTLRVMRPALPVLLASGYADALAENPGVPVVAKPYDVDAVAARLARAIRGVESRTGF